MREIALDTQAATAVAIVDDGSVIARAHNDSGRHHAESITPLVREALAAAGLPAQLAHAGIDRILDMIRTCLNVTGDGAVAVVVAASEGEHSSSKN